MVCECICQECFEPSKVIHDCSTTPHDMTWCEGESHPEYSKLIHLDCAMLKYDKYDELKPYCKECV